jgi:hypothetical protein
MYNETQYKGYPILELKEKAEDKYGVSFGVFKAKLILAHLEVIKQFVAKHDETIKETVQ